MSDAAEAWVAERDRLVGLAYRMLGSVAEAEDVVAEAYLCLQRAGASTVREPAAWLTTATTRLALDVLRSARRTREAYVGTWLPEPVDTSDPAGDVERAESVSMALMVVLEALAPAERAVFVLREAFGYDHAAFAEMLGRSEAAVRQTAHRARAAVAARRPRFEPDRARRDQVAHRFLAACAGDDLGALVALLAEDAVLVSDGGGRVPAGRRPIQGADAVARFLLGLVRVGATRGITATLTELNASPGVLVTEAGTVISAFVLDVVDDRVAVVRAVRNPDKLRHLRSV